MASGCNLWVWLVSVVVRRYIYYKYKKTFKKMNKEIGMILPKKELIQVE